MLFSDMAPAELDKLGNIISSLSALQERIQNSGFARTVGLRHNMGEDCAYYQKSLRLFSKNDLVDLNDLLVKLLEDMDTLERP